ncbi:MAG: Asp-tRNA(Asn)/Glu-tRNA(Gln) amidotransferase subunit GatC [Planctomycetales bacterium]
MAQALTREDVRKVALLGRLKLSESELDAFTTQLGSVLEYVDALKAIPTDNVEPMVHAIEMSNVFREDACRPSLPRDAALKNAPKTDGKYFLVPQIIDAG